MTWGTAIIGLFVLVAASAIVVKLLRDRKKGKCPGCDCSCESCPMGGEGNQ